MATELPLTRTRLSVAEAREHIRAALQDQGIDPTANQLALAMAQSALETGQWKQMWHWNFGNLVRSSYPGDYYVANDSGNIREFRAYPDVASGAADYAKQLVVRRPEWREGLLTGDPRQFAKALKTPPAYYEASEERYANSLFPLWRQFGGSDDALSSTGVVASGASIFLIPALFLAGLVFVRKK